jgi:hypothetical protein
MAAAGELLWRAELLGSQAHRPVPGKLLPRSIQFGIALAPRLPHRVHRMCRVNDGTGASSGQASTLTSVLLPQARQVAKSERTPRLRMLPSVIGRIGFASAGAKRKPKQAYAVASPLAGPWSGDNNYSGH